ncbi:large ribosomal subunit protein mL39 [Halyomorpha halys]|uniref:large ribosomal subunit protein mL39 n=1 Tax=Halyomorpha halys TaxID=286706 RepID=UPI0006D5183F|nr:39S ribosomal protein L39, mitochondrial [Halyomorpha halys]
MKYIRNYRKSFHLVLSCRQAFYSSSSIVQNQNELFNNELERQTSDIGRIEKITVNVQGKIKNETFSMNKHLSTPFNVAQHISKWMMEKSALALIDNSKVWDMHRPLEDDCTLRFLSFTDEDPYHVNNAFWRTCSFLLGAVIQNAFNDSIKVTLHSFPSPQITSGSFVHDAMVSLDDWKPSSDELRCLSADLLKLSLKELPIERLTVQEQLALEIFSENKFKLQHIPDISKNSGGKVTLYRVGSHIDISKGPMVSNTSLIGRCSITSVHPIETDDGKLYRFQGIALPKGLLLNHFAYKILEDRSTKLNTKDYGSMKKQAIS